MQSLKDKRNIWYTILEKTGIIISTHKLCKINTKDKLINIFMLNRNPWELVGLNNSNALSSALKKILIRSNIVKPRNIHTKNWLLTMCSMRSCYVCADIKSIGDFHEGQTRCTECYKLYQKDYLPKKLRQDAARRNRDVRFNPPSYEDQAIFRLEGYEYDHVIPCKGEKVSGLTVINNFIQVPMVINRRKYNKFDADLFQLVTDNIITELEYINILVFDRRTNRWPV